MPDELIRFAASLYNADGVRAAARAFAEVAPLTVRAEGAEILVELGDYDGDPEQLRDELGNHALYETIQRDHDAAEGEC